MVSTRWVAGIAVAGAVAVGGVGGALIGVPGLSSAQPFPGSATQIAATNSGRPGRPAPMSALLDAAAKALNLTTAQLQTKLSDGKTTIADVAKAQNVPLATVIAAMTTADKSRIDAIVNQPWPKFAAGGGRGMRGERGPFGGFGLDAVAKALGVTPADLKTDLGKGQTIAQIAKAKNVDVNGLINTLVADASKRVDAAVTAGHLPADQAAKIKANLKTEITNLVNNGFPKGPMDRDGGFGFGGRHGGPGMGRGWGAVGGPSATIPPTTAPTS